MTLVINGVNIPVEKLSGIDYGHLAGLLDGLLETYIDAIDPDNVTEEQSIEVGCLVLAQEFVSAELKEIEGQL